MPGNVHICISDRRVADGCDLDVMDGTSPSDMYAHSSERRQR